MNFECEVTAIDQLPGVYAWLKDLVTMALPGGEVLVSLSRSRRSTEANRKLWPMLRDISRQVQWHGVTLAPVEWKDVFTAALKGQKLVPGLDGGLVVIGGHTSRMSRQDFSDLIELILSFGTERAVQWSNESEKLILAEHELQTRLK